MLLSILAQFLKWRHSRRRTLSAVTAVSPVLVYIHEMNVVIPPRPPPLVNIETAWSFHVYLSIPSLQGQ